MTDADVDGSHIRTLFLTFFFRQMPELVENGYLYIAQPPLYRFLDTLGRLKRRGYPLPVQRALLGAKIRHKNTFSDRKKTEDLAGLLAEAGMVVDAIETDEEHSLNQIRVTVMGDAKEPAVVSWDLVSSADYALLHSLHDALNHAEHGPYTLTKNGSKQEVQDAEELLTTLLDAGAKGIQVQRYKGLGEMNPDQLWDTTMDPERRTLLQVKVEDMLAADEMFTTLMGDVVEPRREFIVENALDVRVLDI
jgi:DNA gyrase subunit B